MNNATNANANNATNNPPTDIGSGFLEISEKGFGFLRTAQNHYHPKPTDIFVTPDTIKRNFLREGAHIEGATQPPHRGTSPQLKTVLKVNDMVFADYVKAVRFENLTSIDPIEKYKLETAPDILETRIIDLVTPIGKGTRGIIVAPPRTGKTTILKQIANAITTNHPEVFVMVLLIDERPEEVTDFQRSVKAEVVASSNDQDLETHVRLSRFMIERCRRMVECGKDVFVLLDSITRVARAYNSVHGGSGRTMSGGVDARALEIRDFLGALINEQHHAKHFGVIGGDRVGDLFENGRFTRARRGDNDAPRAFANRTDQIHSPGRKLIGRCLQKKPLVGKKRSQIVEVRFLFCFVRIRAINRLHFEQSEETFLVLGRTDLARNQIARLQIKATDLRRRNVDVIRARQVVGIGRAQEAEAIQQHFHDTGANDLDFLGCQLLEHREHQFLLAHRAGVLDAMLFGESEHFGRRLRLEIF